MTAIAAERYTGASIKRSEDPRILTGAGRYVDDIKLPGMLHAAFVRSPMAHARVLSVDVSAARALPGVVAVVTGAELEAMTVPGPDALMALMGWAGPTPEFTLLATHKVRLVGDPLVVVIAENRVYRRGRLRAGGGRVRRPSAGRGCRLRARPGQPAAVRQPR